MQTIRKLNKLPITVAHLQDTGVGRTINSLRKLDGSIGKESRDLVQKWRNMVEEENSEDTENERQSSEESSIKESKLIFRQIILSFHEQFLISNYCNIVNVHFCLRYVR